jgi:DNA-directed RNA polymerase specialized sigma24 family protein
VEGYSHKEIAELLNIQESTSKNTVHEKQRPALKDLISINDKEMYGTLGK